MNRLLGKCKQYITDPDYRFRFNFSKGMYRSMPDDVFLRKYFRAIHGYDLNLENPKSFSEKLQWLKLYDRRPEYTDMVDKYTAKEYVAQKVGKQYIIPTLGVWSNPKQVDYDSLPNQFVLKCTHDSHGIIICQDKTKLDIPKTEMILSKGLKTNYYRHFREWPYRDVKPRIIAEKYLSNDGKGLTDYKIHCFSGEPKVILVCKDRFTPTGMTEDFFDCHWNHLDVSRPGKNNSNSIIEKPEQLDEMMHIARELSKGIPFIRVDLYIVGGNVFFGELTFYPASGFVQFEPTSFDYELGSYLILQH